jgi:AcrR family transcriptional regulator
LKEITMARSRGRKAREPLSKDRIEEAALELIEHDGLEGFSTRKLAAGLGCEAVSVYHYYPSKTHLLDALFDRVIGGLPPDDPTLPWRKRVEDSILAYRETAHRYPRFFQFIALHRHNSRIGLAWLQRILSILRDAGLDTETTARFFRVVGYYVVGGVLDETSGYAKGHSAAEPVPEDEVARDFPLVAAVNPWFKPAEHDATFRLGLDTLLDRVEDEARNAGKDRERGSAPPVKVQVATVRSSSQRGRSSRSSSR